MKFNLEIEIDYIEEDGDLDDTIKSAIINKVVKLVEGKIDSKLEALVIEAATRKANEMCTKMTQDFLNKKFTQQDKWGDEIRVGVSVKDILKEKFENFWSVDVDEHGGEKSGYGKKQSRVKWLIDKQIKEHSTTFAKTLTNDTENKIKNNMKESLQKSIGAKLVTELGFDKLLIEHKNKN